MLPEAERATFMGIVRDDGQVAHAQLRRHPLDGELLGDGVHKIAEYFTPERLAEYPNVDGVVAFAHDTGCGMEMTGEPWTCCAARWPATRATRTSPRRWSSAWAASATRSPGCSRRRACTVGANLRTFVMQDTGGTRKTIEAGIAAVKEMLPRANA